MNRPRMMALASAVLAVWVAGAPQARAELYKDVARGLALLDFQFSGERNLLGDGITVNTSAFYNNRTFDFGVAQLTLTGQLSASAGFTRRGIPGANFSLNTGGGNLNYTFTVNNGLQDLTATGTALVNVRANVNALGFYDKQIQISNRGTFTTDGVLLDEGGTLAFDVGPINQSGNLYADLLARLTQPLFEAAGTENFFAKLSDQATKVVEATKNIDFLRARAAAGEPLTEAELTTLVNNTILAAVLGGEPSPDLFARILAGDGVTMTSETPGTAYQAVPEPVLMTPLALLLLSLRRIRRA
ncbi:MAG: hypothetical protein AMXMBFR83_17520 [Phycisphaerae bacterium]